MIELLITFIVAILVVALAIYLIELLIAPIPQKFKILIAIVALLLFLLYAFKGRI